MKYYDLDGTECSFDRFAELFGASNQERIIRKTELATTVGGETFEVSTVFLGIDHGFDDNRQPVLWETMIFGGPDGFNDAQVRYSSLEEARSRHERVVQTAISLGAVVLSDHIS